VPQHGLHHIDEARDIDPVVGKRRRHRFPDIGERGEMDDGGGAVLREGGVERRGIEDVAFNERAEAHGMILLFHTGIVNRPRPDLPSDISSDRMRVSTLDLIARRFPKLTIIGAHLGNPDYAWAAEIGRWNPNLYFDLSGSTLIKKEQDYSFFRSIFWWTNTASPHTPKGAASAFEKIVFGSDVFNGEIEEFDRELERYHRMLDSCSVPAEVQANIFAGTMWKILKR